MSFAQSGILLDCSRMARHLMFYLTPRQRPEETLQTLADLVDGEATVVVFGLSLVLALGDEVEGLRIFPARIGPVFEIPSTRGALWFWLRGEDRGELLHRTRMVQHALAPAFRLEKVIDAFQYGESLDMVGADDDINDSLFTFTRPISGNCYWCPPMLDGQLDLRALDLA
jgi:porphyrinogen peroxidase